jgi:DNA (cytosine-5)-methyltransferase 1
MVRNLLKHRKGELMRDLIIDCFAGGGGASVGIEMALGRPVDIAINHDPDAIAMHEVNHPDTLHVQEDIFKVDILKYTKGKHVALMWASPDCTSHSKAKGGKPREKGLRILPWAVYKHAKTILPDVILMENVEEIQDWGPLDKHGYPIKERKGEDYNKFINAMKSLGYEFDSRELIAADYGAPTTRKRWYAIFRRDGKPIVWPTPTRNKLGANGLKKWEPIANYLNFNDFGKSIFGRKKPLADKTMNRIARGMDKFVFNCSEPFVIDVTKGITVTHAESGEHDMLNPYMVQVNHSGDNFRGQNIDCPIPTITQKHGFGIVSPIITPFMMVNNTGHPGGNINNPIHTITTGGHHGVVTPYIMQIGQTGFTNDRNRSVKESLSTVVTKNEHCLISPMLIQYHSETGKKEVRGQSVSEPIMTIDTSPRYALVSAFLTKFYKSGCGQSLYEPIHTITTSAGHFGQISILAIDYKQLKENGVDEETATKCTWVSQFIMEYYGCGIGQTVNDPLHTVVTKDRFALITILGSEYAILDIFLRMLEPEELKLGNGFPSDYIIDFKTKDGKPYPKSKQVERIGNSVVPIVSQVLVEANCSNLKVGERVPNMIIDDSQQQLRFA